ncbi:hypothetical protein EON80_00205 [bacterium]|nr:MAG: hypothetical protein EON80_00205 [bacterium]
MLEFKIIRFDSGHGAPQKKLRRRPGFTLLQLLLAVGILGALAAISLSVFGRSKVGLHRAKCDVHLKQIALALDAFRQERGRLPNNLNELVVNDYIAPQILRCDDDRTYEASKAANPKYNSYEDGYILREPRDSVEMPIVLCYFHEKDGRYGAQAFKGGDTRQFATHLAKLDFGNIRGAVKVERPGEGLLALPNGKGKSLELRGGDRIQTGAGSATVQFEDGSTANIESNSDMSVLQSFTEGQRSGVLYTVVRQFAGRVNYYVNPGSNFDVATPTATAGAIGTRFTIQLVAAASLGDDTTLKGGQIETILTVTEHRVALTTTDRTIEVSDKEPAVIAHDPGNALKERVPRLLGALSSNVTNTVTPQPTATLQPTATPQPTSTPRPTATPQPTATATPKPTNTPKPTATPKPTNTPKPTATPKPKGGEDGDEDEDDEDNQGHG